MLAVLLCGVAYGDEICGVSCCAAKCCLDAFLLGVVGGRINEERRGLCLELEQLGPIPSWRIWRDANDRLFISQVRRMQLLI